MAAIDTVVSRRSAGTGFLASAWAQFQSWRLARQTMAELRALSDRELEDIGLTRIDIERIALERS